MGLPVCLAMNLIAASTIAIDAGAFFSEVQVRQILIDLLGRDLAFVEARGDLHKCLVDVATGLCGLLDLLAPIQKMRGGVAVCPFSIVRDGLKLKRLRCFGNGLFGGDAQCLVHVESSLFCSGCQVLRLFSDILHTQPTKRTSKCRGNTSTINNLNPCVHRTL